MSPARGRTTARGPERSALPARGSHLPHGHSGPQRCPHPNPQNPRKRSVARPGGPKATDGIRLAGLQMIPNHLSGVGAIAGSLRVAGRGRWCRTPRDGGRSPRPGCERPGEPGKQRRATDSARGPRKAGAPPTPILTSGTLKLRAVLGHCVRELCYSNSRSLIQKKEQVLFKMPQIPDSLAARGGRLLAMDA